MEIEDYSPLELFGMSPGPYNLTDPNNLNEFLRHSLPKGAYDINYVIALLSIIEEQCSKHLLNMQDFTVSLKESVKKLRGSLLVERDYQTSSDPRVLIRCERCKEAVVIPRRLKANWVCPCENNLLT